VGNPTGFKENNRQVPTYKKVEERVENYNDFSIPLKENELKNQAARCMDCGIPFCHSDHGCPLGNIIPDFNDHVYKGRWEEALQSLLSTNNFPEFTGRICPAPCETACVLGIIRPPVTIKNIELSISDKAYENNWMTAKKPGNRSGKTIAIVGSGPAGLAAADQLNKAGHTVTVFERADRIGGLLMYGIPNFKLEKNIINRRVKLMEEEGIIFKTNANVGLNVDLKELQKEFDALLLTGGSTEGRDLPIDGRDAKGVHLAMLFLTQNTKRVLGDTIDEEAILATGKDVIVIGGGDTGSDCVGTSIRQKAKSVTQIELMPRPSVERAEDNPWPLYSRIFRTSSSQAEGCNRDFSILTKEFLKDDLGNLKGLSCVKIEWEKEELGQRSGFKEISGTEFVMEAQLALLAMGFLHPEHKGLLEQLEVEKDVRGNVKTDASYATSIDGVFAAGDIRRGQSLVVWAISEGRECANNIDQYLTGHPSRLYAKDHSFCEG
jgi:glutamate synthase (NADPH/NADH) small chain